MTNLVGILTTQLKPNEAAASGSTGAKVVKRLPIKIPPPKAFEGDRDYERVATWLREVENFFRAMAVEENQKVQTPAGLLGGDALTWWARKFIHRLQPWARKLIFRMPQLPDNLQDLMRMAESLRG